MRKRALVSMAGGLALALGCSTTHTLPLQSSDLSPAAEGDVKVKPQGGNTAIAVDVKHLAPPDRLAPDAIVYVVWARPLSVRAQPQNIGALNVDRNREGKLETLTPYKNFEIFVTPESTPLAEAPTGDHVLFTRVVASSS